MEEKWLCLSLGGTTKNLVTAWMGKRERKKSIPHMFLSLRKWLDYAICSDREDKQRSKLWGK